MDAKKQEKGNFFKRNIYYFVVAFVLLATITVTVILMVTNGNKGLDAMNNSGEIENNNGNSQIIDSSIDNGSSEDQKDPDVDKPNDNVPDKPVEVVVSFIVPVEDGTILCDYTETSLVYNKTLNIYTGHLAIDFSAPMGHDVKVVYGGTVESVETSYLKGTTVTVDHGNGLKTIYNSIDVDENMVKGKKLAQGDVIGKVSDNNKQEYKDGPHLHFEVMENGQKISPYKYLTISEK